MALADSIAALGALGEVKDAYTTGTVANLALRNAVGSAAASAQSQAASASASLNKTALTGAAAILAAASAAEDLARAIAAQAWLSRVQTVLDRP